MDRKFALKFKFAIKFKSKWLVNNTLKILQSDQFYLVPRNRFTFFQTLDRCRPWPGRNDC
jgi:hypothetical protein